MSLLNKNIPKHARTVIIGGGIIGTSVAYHLSLNKDFKDTILLEQGVLTCGTTWHAAGLIGQMRNTSAEIILSKYGSELYNSLSEKGYNTSWKKSGSLSLSSSEDRLFALKRNLGRAKSFGIEAQIISPEEAYEKCPYFDINGINAALWLPNDGTAISSDCTMALSKAAKDNGVKVFENTRVKGYKLKNNKVIGVEYDDGFIDCEIVVVCSGLWTRQLIPYAQLHPCYHMYIISEPCGIPGEIPFLRDLDGLFYAREWSGGICMGGFELDAKPCFINEEPGVLQFHLFNEDYDQFNPILENALKRIPLLNHTGVRQFLNGPESFTSDNAYILGESPYNKNLFIAAGFNSSGIASAGGAGLALSEWIINGRPTRDLWSVDPRRFAKFHGSKAFLLDRVTETLGLHYSIPYPFREFSTARGLRLSPLYEIFKSKGALFGNKFGWERVNVFLDKEFDVKSILNKWTFHEDIDKAISQEHINTRNNVSIFDLTSFSKFVIQGKDSLKAIQILTANNVDVEIDTTVYTPMLNESGGYEADVTITRIAENEFLIISPTSNTIRDFSRIKRFLEDYNATITDLTSSYSVLSIMGPNSRVLLESVTGNKNLFSNENFKFGTSKEIELGMCITRINRITYVGTLGYEIYIPSEFTKYVYKLIQSKNTIGLKDAGYYSIESLRIEKGYRAWGHELKSDITPLEAGLGFTIYWDKQFIGKEALIQQKEKGITRRIVSFTIETNKFLLGDEPVYNNNEIIGYVTSTRYGYSLGKWVGLCLIKYKERLNKNEYYIEVFGEKIKASLSLKSPYDPDKIEIFK